MCVPGNPASMLYVHVIMQGTVIGTYSYAHACEPGLENETAELLHLTWINTDIHFASTMEII